MINLYILLSFNVIIIILSYFFKKKIIVIYPFVFLFFISMYIKLSYKKNYELIEGFNKSEVDTFWDELDDKVDDNLNNELFGKINSVLKLLVELEKTPEDDLYGDKQCKGEFKITKSDKICGFDEYDEYKYVITEPGVGCKYPPGHTERKNKRLCKLDESCVLDQDCDIGKCTNGVCNMDFQCDSTKIDICDEEGCLKLNDTFGKGFYKYDKKIKKCILNKCNKDKYYDCDNEEDCTNLGYNFRWRGVKAGSKKEQLGKIYGDAFSAQCELIGNDVSRCSQHKCPIGQTTSKLNKDYLCKKKISESDKKLLFPGNNSIVYNEKGEMLIDECEDEVCCQPKYTCAQYYGDTGQCQNCKNTGEKVLPLSDCGPTCFLNGVVDKPIVNYKNLNSDSSNQKKIPYYYFFQKQKPTTAPIIKTQKCKELKCDLSECTTENKCVCNNGTPAKDADCAESGQNCNSCDTGYHSSQPNYGAGSSCVKNQCNCTGGKAVEGTECISNDAHICSICNSGFSKQEGKCVENICKCEDGVHARGQECTSNDAHICSSCNPGFSKKEGKCVRIICSCSMPAVAANVDGNAWDPLENQAFCWDLDEWGNAIGGGSIRSSDYWNSDCRAATTIYEPGLNSGVW